MVLKSCKKLQKVAKSCDRFFCKHCDYTTSRKSSYTKHLQTKKHLEKAFKKCSKSFKRGQKSCEKEYICEICNKEYKNRNSLWYHKKKCKEVFPCNFCYKKYETIELIDHAKNCELRPLSVGEFEKLKSFAGTTNNTNNNTTNNISINVYLNEHCKDALNLADFVKKIQLSVEDVLKTNFLGLEDGVSNVVINELKDLSANKRPIHCVDVKRNKFYIKDDDEWKKEDAEKIIKAAEKIRIQHIKVLEGWENDHPNYLTLGHKDHTMWQHMVATFTKKITEKDKGRILNAIKKRVMIKEAMGEI